METLMDTAVLSRSWVRVSRSWESWVNGLLRTQTVADEEVLCATLRNGRAFKLYVNTSCSSPIMKGELLVDGKVISRLVRTAASLLTEWVFEAEDIFTVEMGNFGKFDRICDLSACLAFTDLGPCGCTGWLFGNVGFQDVLMGGCLYGYRGCECGARHSKKCHGGKPDA